MRSWLAVTVVLLAVPGRAQSDLEIVLPVNRPGLEAAVVELIDAEIAAMRREPVSAASRGRLGLVYEANLLWAEAEACFEQAARLDPGDEIWRLHWAVALQSLGRVSDALDLLETLAGEATLPATLQRLGYLRLEHGDLEGAADAFERLIVAMPESAAGYLGAGEVALQQDETAAAVERLEKALAVDSSAFSAHYQLGLAYRKLGRLDDAKRELALGADSVVPWVDDPISSEVRRLRVFLTARIDLAAAYLGAGRPGDAAMVLEEQLRRHPSNVTVLNNLAIAYLRLDRLAEARALLDRALGIDLEHFTTYLNLSSWAQRSGLNEEARQRARQAREKAPGVAATHQAVARTLLLPDADGTRPTRERQEQARLSYEKAVDVGADHPGVYLDLARLSSTLMLQTKAFEVLDEALERWPDFWPADLQRAWMLSRQGRFVEAEEALAKVRAVVPEHPDIASIERWIDERRGSEGDG